ncbi:peptidoglycan-binding protein, partial [Streptomyces sp. NPDC058583]|uniref:peptidoglycan-binding protein n=1 Tax=unclassified Streptomyces TaxID=2593676 RepID=UPI00365BA5B0
LAAATVAAGAYGVVSVSGDAANAASPTSYGVRGIDTSHHNAHPIRWSTVKASGESFVFHKATQGTRYRDPKFAGDFAGALSAGLMAAPYHFYDSGTGAAQAAHFVRTVKAAGYDAKRPGQLPPVVDLEKTSGRCPAGVNSTQVAAFLTKAKEAFGVSPIVYTSKDFTDTCLGGRTAALAGSPLWVPRYRSGSTEPASIGGRSWSIWQYTDRGSVSGINGNVDRNVYKGTLTQLRRLAHLAPTSGQPAPTPGSTTPDTAKPWPVLKASTRGTDVRTAQHLLNAAGHNLAPDGAFGPATTSAVKAFQNRNRLNADGIVGTDTWNKMIRTVRQGSSGEAVKAAQAQLAGYGYSVKIDGAFGPATTSAVKAFQNRNRLDADGIVGANTWNKLVAGTTTHTPAPTTPAPSGNGKLTQRQALAQLAAAGIKRPVGRTSLEGVRARTIQGVIALKKASRCTIVITGGTESGHSTKGNYSHAKGYKLDLRTRDEGRCVTNWIKNTQRKGKPRGNDPRWHGTLNGISAEYVYETPRGGGIHWDITFK